VGASGMEAWGGGGVPYCRQNTISATFSATYFYLPEISVFSSFSLLSVYSRNLGTYYLSTLAISTHARLSVE
jgi:hypothetical protein